MFLRGNLGDWSIIEKALLLLMITFWICSERSGLKPIFLWKVDLLVSIKSLLKSLVVASNFLTVEKMARVTGKKIRITWEITE